MGEYLSFSLKTVKELDNIGMPKVPHNFNFPFETL